MRVASFVHVLQSLAGQPVRDQAFLDALHQLAAEGPNPLSLEVLVIAVLALKVVGRPVWVPMVRDELTRRPPKLGVEQASKGLEHVAPEGKPVSCTLGYAGRLASRVRQ